MKAVYILPTLTLLGGIGFIASLNSVALNDSPKYSCVDKTTMAPDENQMAIPSSLVAAGVLIGIILIAASAAGFTMIAQHCKDTAEPKPVK